MSLKIILILLALSGAGGVVLGYVLRVLIGLAQRGSLELEIKQVSGIKRIVRKVGRNDNLIEMSGELDQYKGFVVADIALAGLASAGASAGAGLASSNPAASKDVAITAGVLGGLAGV